jgi:hypothetical protein
MHAFRAALLAFLLAAAVQAAPAPFLKNPRRAPSPQLVLERLRAEGLDVGALRHESGDRWTIQQSVTTFSGRRTGMRLVVVRRVIIAPGDPTEKLRDVLKIREALRKR